MEKLALYQACFLHNPTPKLLLQRDNFCIIEANASAAALFDSDCDELRGRDLDFLCNASLPLLSIQLEQTLASSKLFFHSLLNERAAKYSTLRFTRHY